MTHPTPSSTLRPLLWLMLVLILAPASLLADDAPKPLKPGDPAISIPLGPLGLLGIPPGQLIGGATMFTVHFADDTHILLTFNSRGLIPRLNDGVPQADDRLITALLVELPTGKVLARTTWHTRDRDQYLWPLAHGLFVLRIKAKLSVIDPVHGLAATGNAFQEQVFLQMDHPIGYISVSPGGELLCIETVVPPHAEGSASDGTTQTSGAPQTLQFATQPTVDLRFYRLVFVPGSGGRLQLRAQSAGLVSARGLIRVAATAEGFLDTLKESNRTWLFDFQSHAGKRLELAPFDTTCAPSPYFVSRTEFIALGCRGSDTRIMLSGFNLRGEQPWIQVLAGQQISPILVTAPDAGRFAFSRILVAGSFYDLQNLRPDELTGQEVQVIQNHDGRVLLHVQPSPIQRTGQNFDLSEDGLNLTIIRNGNLEVYRLPELTAKDADQVKHAAADLLEKSEVRIGLMSKRPVATQQTAPQQTAPPAALEPAITINAPSAAAPTANAGDAQPGDAQRNDGPRAAPSLYTPDYPKNPKL